MADFLIEVEAAPTFPATVLLGRPGREPVEIAFTFRHLTRDALRQWGERVAGDAVDEAALVAELIESWGPQIKQPYSLDALRTLLQNYHTATVDIAAAYRKALQDARIKN